MSTRLFAALFTALLLIGISPVLFIQSFGFASDGVTSGFLIVMTDAYHIAGLIAIGVMSAYLGGEVILLLPLCTLLMMATGSFTEMNASSYHALPVFMLGAILLFSASACCAANRLLYITPAAAWAFFTGGDFIRDAAGTNIPLFFLLGNIVGSALILAIGSTLGITLAERLRAWTRQMKSTTAIASFLSMF